jgi:thiamine-phosphate pyrophosphorylase
MRAGLPRIWIITNPKHPDGPVAPIARALDGCPPGMVGVQLRAKEVPGRQLVAWGRELRAVTNASGSALTVNRRADVARIVGADGVHLPELGLSPRELRAQWPQMRLIGVSRHDRIGLERAADDRATFAFLSPVFPVPGKGDPMGIDGFRTAIADVGIPTYALGGIEGEHLKPLIAVGAAGVAVRRAIYDAPDPRAALHGFLRELDKTGANGD